MDDEIIELLEEMTDEWRDELDQLDSLTQSCPELELECMIKKETLEEVIRKVDSIINEFVVIE
ncbi:MAG TPA: hypothetical protein DDW90_08155 [Cyanobacteria bacterium UBA9971]|nr:hypothetical protein [Cyanobacteria bacterium UBA9971]HCR36149.1 hypothetical protein [Candidatus Woesebacteria bacterium]